MKNSPHRPAGNKLLFHPQREARVPARLVCALFAILATVLLRFAPVSGAERTALSPGINIFTPEQDIQIGKQNAEQAEKQLRMLNDPRVDNYLNTLGKRLAAHAPGYKFPYQYKCVNDMAINAFALPGGYIFINRGAVEAAATEAQLAGVMAHETSHVALRHGTNQATKAQLTSVPFAILGEMIGGDTTEGLLAQLAANFSLNSILLKYSRTDESQADILGTQILYDSGYDPRALAQFFEKLNAESKGKLPAQFFSDHPNPENRVERVEEEVDKLGGPPPNYVSDSKDFHEIKDYLRSVPPPPQAHPNPAPPDAKQKPEPPSAHTNKFQTDVLELRYPDNWKSTTSDDSFSLMPPGGVVTVANEETALAYGVLFDLFHPQTDANNRISIEDAANQLIASLEKSNPNLHEVGNRKRMQVDNTNAISVNLTNDSPVGGNEKDWLVGITRPNGLAYFICVAPEKEFSDYDAAFQNVIHSVRFRK